MCANIAHGTAQAALGGGKLEAGVKVIEKTRLNQYTNLIILDNVYSRSNS